MRKIANIFVLSLIFNIGNAQKLLIELGQGSFQMTEMKSFQADIQNQLIFDAQIVEEFPAYYTFKINFFLIEKTGYSLGITGGQINTGGRISYGDFSGSFKADSNLSGTYFGLVAEHEIISKNKLELNLTASPYVNFTSLDFTTEYIVLQAREVQIVDFVSTNLGLEGGLNLRYNLNPLFIQFSLGANIDFGSEIELKSNRDGVLQTSDGSIVKSNWTGYRAGFGIGINFGK